MRVFKFKEFKEYILDLTYSQSLLEEIGTGAVMVATITEVADIIQAAATIMEVVAVDIIQAAATIMAATTMEETTMEETITEVATTESKSPRSLLPPRPVHDQLLLLVATFIYCDILS